MEKSFQEFLVSHNLPSFEPEYDVGWKPVGDDKYLTYVADQKHLKNGSIMKIVVISSWKTTERFTYKNYDEDATSSSEIKEAVEELKERQRASTLEKNQKAKLEARRLWEKSIPVNGVLPEYMKRKGLSQAYGARLDGECPDTVLIPMKDTNEEIWGIQKIYASGDKRFISGQRGSGIFHVIGEPIGHTKVTYLCEGFATGASIHDATGETVVVAFMLHNLKPVAEVLKQTYKSVLFVVAADNDAHNTPNTGIEKAKEAARVLNCPVVWPTFKVWKDRSTSDFNDLAREEGLNAVRSQLTAINIQSSASTNFSPLETEIEPMQLPKKRGDKQPMPTQQEVADYFLNFCDGTLIKQEKDVFYYDGKRWKNIDLVGEHQIKVQLQRAYHGKGSAATIKSIYELFLCGLPSVPRGVNLHAPHPFCINLQNGTLHFIENGRDYKMEFREHRREDYLTNLLPFNFEADFGSKNEKFLDMLESLFEGDADKEEKILALQEMFGACLIGAFPHLFFLYGKPGTGKSTVILLASRFVSEENWCSVEPCEFHGFNIESMIGKLLNFETDVSLNKPMEDGSLKRMVDGRPMQIQRKFKVAIKGRLPAVHIFGGNEIPTTLEGEHRAHTRRWTFIEFNKKFAEGNYDKNFGKHVFDAEPQGIFNWALKGLMDLLSREGHYTQPASGRVRMEEWQSLSDPVGQFLKDLEDGILEQDYGLMVRETGRVRRAELWKKYSLWFDETQLQKSATGRNAFFKSLRQKGVKEREIDGYDCFLGIELTENTRSI